jgi:molybdopterin converting factor small subunit
VRFLLVPDCFDQMGDLLGSPSIKEMQPVFFVKENNMANVRLAPVLRASAGGSKQVSVQGTTLGEALADLFQQYPSLKEQIQPGDELSRFVNIYVNDQDVRYLQGLNTVVGSGDTITLLPAMAGGF